MGSEKTLWFVAAGTAGDGNRFWLNVYREGDAVRLSPRCSWNDHVYRPTVMSVDPVKKEIALVFGVYVTMIQLAPVDDAA
ncbi:MAG TPA: hypothetical protein VFJ15_03665 [Oleiagrimonas sp.]|nr:hypothetical protein [Oleiagrimonas sp.]